MTIKLDDPVVVALMARPAKLADANELDAFITSLDPNPTRGLKSAITVATYFVNTYTGSFAYVLNTRRDVARYGEVPVSKLKGILNVLRASAIAQRDGKSFTPSRFANNGAARPPAIDSGFNFDHVPAGEYSVPHNGGHVWVMVDKPGAASKWSGHVFVSGGTDLPTFKATHKLSRAKLGNQRPGGTLRFHVADDALVRSLVVWAGVTATSFPDGVSGGGVLAPAPAPTPAKKTPARKVRPPAPVAEPVAPVADPVPDVPPVTEPTVSIRDRVRQMHGL